MARRIPAAIENKASALLTDYLNGEINARPLKAIGGLTIEINYRYRLLCRDTEKRKEANHWLLLSHEDYSKYVYGNRH